MDFTLRRINGSNKRPERYARRPQFFRAPVVPLCTTNGRHTPGSAWARECSLRPGGALDQRRQAAQASAGARRRGVPVQDPGVEPSGNGTTPQRPA
jgi:hypothetical protein